MAGTQVRLKSVLLKGPLNPYNNFTQIPSLTCILKVLLIFIMVGTSEGPTGPEKCLKMYKHDNRSSFMVYDVTSLRQMTSYFHDHDDG